MSAHGSASRMTDVDKHPQLISGIVGLGDVPLVGLKEAIADVLAEPEVEVSKDLAAAVEDCLEHAEDRLEEAEEKGTAERLSVDELACLLLYSKQFAVSRLSWFAVINRYLREKDRRRLFPFHKYLRLFASAAQKLKPFKGKVARGVKLGVEWAKFYRDGKKFRWWAFSSCTQSTDLLESNSMFLGSKGQRTLFQIDCTNGLAMDKYSDYPEEKEVLLLPGTRLEVISQGLPLNEMAIVFLREIKPSILWQIDSGSSSTPAAKPTEPAAKPTPTAKQSLSGPSKPAATYSAYSTGAEFGVTSVSHYFKTYKALGWRPLRASELKEKGTAFTGAYCNNHGVRLLGQFQALNAVRTEEGYPAVDKGWIVIAQAADKDKGNDWGTALDENVTPVVSFVCKKKNRVPWPTNANVLQEMLQGVALETTMSAEDAHGIHDGDPLLVVKGGSSSPPAPLKGPVLGNSWGGHVNEVGRRNGSRVYPHISFHGLQDGVMWSFQVKPGYRYPSEPEARAIYKIYANESSGKRFTVGTLPFMAVQFRSGVMLGRGIGHNLGLGVCKGKQAFCVVISQFVMADVMEAMLKIEAYLLGIGF